MQDEQPGSAGRFRRWWNGKKADKFPRFEFSPLASSEIRLLRFVPGDTNHVHCTLETYVLGECPEFCALSYTWGSAFLSRQQHHNEPYARAGKTATLICERRVIPITQSLYDASIQLLASEPGQRFWIDAVCINQDDLREKSEQVEHMAQIYRRASKVIVWLGTPCKNVEDFIWVTETLWPAVQEYGLREPDRDITLRHMEDQALAEDLGIDLSEPMIERIRGFVSFFKDRRWFSRIWTIQESDDWSKIRMLCGSHELSFEKAMMSATMLEHGHWARDVERYDILENKRSSNNTSLSARRSIYNILQIATGRITYDSLKNIVFHLYGPQTKIAQEMSWLLYTMVWTMYHECTDPRDKIFSVLALVKPYFPNAVERLPKPDYYSTVEQVYLDFAKATLSHTPRMSILSLNGDPSRRRIKSLPSWVPDFSTTPQSGELLVDTGVERYVYDAMNCDRCAPASRSIDGTILSCEGAVFDSVADICAISNSELNTGFGPLLEFYCRLPRKIGGYDRIEACWRTFIGDYWRDVETNEEHFPAPQFLEESFGYFLKDGIARRLFLGPEKELSAEYYDKLLKILDPGGTSSAIPNMQSVLKHLSILQSMREEGPEDYSEYCAQHNLQVFKISRPAANFIGGRRFFVTTRGYLGLGPESTAVGDRVTFIHDALVPFVLRENWNSDYMQLIGECFLHGFMNGEVLEEQYELAGRISTIKIS